MVRYLDAIENRNAGKLFYVCRAPGYHVAHESISELIGPQNVPTEYYFSKIVMTRSAYTLDFANLGSSPDYGIADNDCVPTFKGAKHPGYALFNNDKYFDTNAAEKALQPTYLLGPSGITKRWVEGVGLVVAEGNSTRVATPKELQEELPFESCADETCSREMEALKRVIQTVREQSEIEAAPPTAPSRASVESATPVAEEVVVTAAVAGRPESGSGRVLAQPRQTGDAYL
jgi:chitinase